MKFKVKLLAAAVALAAAAPALADINTSNPPELFLSVWSTSLHLGYTRDLGVSFSNFLTGSALVPFGSTNGGTTAWSNGTFTGTTPAASAGSVLGSGYTLTFAVDNRLVSSGLLSAPDTVWNVAALQPAGTSAVKVLTTVDAASSLATIGTTQGAQLSSIPSTYLGNVNSLANGATSSHGTATTTHGSDTVTDASAAYAGASGFGANFASKVNGLNNTGAINDSLGFLQLAYNVSLVNTDPIAVTQYTNATWSLDDQGSLVYSVGSVAAIPEPGEWAMLLAGLMMLGGVARRRMSA